MKIDLKNFNAILRIFIGILFSFQDKNEVVDVVWDSLISGCQENEVFYNRKDYIIDQLLDFLESIYILKDKKLYRPITDTKREFDISQKTFNGINESLLPINNSSNNEDIKIIIKEENECNIDNGITVAIYCKIVDAIIDLLKIKGSIIIDSIKDLDSIKTLKKDRFISLLTRTDSKLFYYRQEVIFNKVIESNASLMQSFLNKISVLCDKKKLFSFLGYLFTLIKIERYKESFKKYEIVPPPELIQKKGPSEFEKQMWNKYPLFILDQFSKDYGNEENQQKLLKFFIKYFGCLIYQTNLPDLEQIFEEMRIFDICLDDLFKIQVKLIIINFTIIFRKIQMQTKM